METGPPNAETILCHLRRSRFKNRKIGEIKNLIDHVEKHGFENKTEQQRVVEELVRLLASGFEVLDTADHSSWVGCVIWITHLQSQQRLPLLSELLFGEVITWVWSILKRNVDCVELICCICIAFEGLFKTHSIYVNSYFGSVTRDLLKYLCWDNAIFVILNAMRCLNSMMDAVSTEVSKECSDIIFSLGEKIVQLLYCDNKPAIEQDVIPLFLIHALQLANRAASANADYANKYISELLGLSKAFFHFGVGNIATCISTPQKIFVSQQALYDSPEEFDINVNSEKTRVSGGKTIKTRKPRLNARTSERNVASRSPERKNQLLAFEVKTSDSDMSEPESGTSRVLYERNKMAKIRLTSITLVGTVARTVDRRLIYGYWHGLFPSRKGENADNILYIGHHDPNMRCRCAALQVCSQLLYGSRGFLLQAETDAKRCPATFIPFSVSLGQMIIAIFNEVTGILATESSLPVITQALKCLAVLVQAAPFQKLQKGFVPELVRHVRPFVFHRDVAIQVSALMVMEFLLSSTDVQTEIADAVGLSQISLTPCTKSNPLSDDELGIIDDEEYEETDHDESNAVDLSEQNSHTGMVDNLIQRKHSWLLLRVLENLGNHDKAVATSVRIESLQVLIALASHFPLLRGHIVELGEVLKYVIDNPMADIRIHAARCIETLAHQISLFLLETSSSSSGDTKILSQYWSNLMPAVFEHIRRDKEDLATVRVALCDALSNIGVVMYENCPHSLQMRLLSFLSGVSSDVTDDVLVRAASARSLAVYALYPSLRGDFVFVENTAELILRLVNDKNLSVRVKTCWSLGNISDALLMEKSTGSKESNEHISDDLLFRMIEASTTACADNDKVRCNAVRALGNLLRLITDDHFRADQTNRTWQQTFEKAVCKLTDCLRSSGNAKVKWNTCYAISNILRNSTIFYSTDLNWEKTLYPALCHVIVHHPNFKVRINATIAISSIAERSHFGTYFEQFWMSILEAIQQSYNLDNFHEYNHRDNLQDQLCLALAHMLNCSLREDWSLLKNRLLPHLDTIQNTWKRVVLRMLPERAAPLLSCPIILMKIQTGEEASSADERNAINFLVETFALTQ